MADWLDSSLTYPNIEVPFPPEPPVYTWPEKELECKVDMSQASEEERLAVAQGVFKTSNTLVARQPRRAEHHHAYTAKGIRTILTCTHEVWIKRKRNPRILLTPNSIPILQRQEFLSDPRQPIYQQLLVDTLSMRYVGSFQKEMVDLWVWYRDLHFTVTLADATARERTLTQIEFEYDGHHPSRQSPSQEEVLASFDELIGNNSAITLANITTQTKFEWLTQ